MPTPCIVYTRISRDDPREFEYGLDAQLERCREYCAAHDLTVVREIQDDITSQLLARPGLDEARDMLAAGTARAIVVARLDRLIRIPPHLWILRDEFEAAGAELHFADSGISRDDPTGRLGENIRAVIADYERELIIEKTRQGRIQKAKRNMWVGAGAAPYGHVRVGQGRDAVLEVAPDEQRVVQQVAALMLGWPSELAPDNAQPLKMLRIAGILTERGVPTPASTRQHRQGGWHVSSLYRVMSRRSLLGEFSYAGHVVRIPALAILDEATFDAVQARIRANRDRATRNQRHEYLLSGHLRCQCGGAMSGAMTRGALTHSGDRRYRCQKPRAPVSDRCGLYAVPAEPLEAAVWAWACALLAPGVIEQALDDLAREAEHSDAPRRARLVQLTERIQRDERRMADLLSEFGAAAEGSPSLRESLRAQVRRLAADVDREREERARLERDLARPVAIDAAVVHAGAERIRALMDGDYAARRMVLDVADVRAVLVPLADGVWYALDVTTALLPGAVTRIEVEDTRERKRGRKTRD